MLSIIEAQVKNGNQITGYETFWCADPGCLNYDDGEFEITGEVSDSELLREPGKAEEAYCGDGDSCRTAGELTEFACWLAEGHEYPISVALQCAANLAKSRED